MALEEIAEVVAYALVVVQLKLPAKQLQRIISVTTSCSRLLCSAMSWITRESALDPIKSGWEVFKKASSIYCIRLNVRRTTLMRLVIISSAGSLFLASKVCTTSTTAVLSVVKRAKS